MFSVDAGRSVQHPNSANMKPCCCNRCSMWFNIVLLIYTTPSLEKNVLIGAYLALKLVYETCFSIHGAFLHVQVVKSRGTHTHPSHQGSGFWTELIRSWMVPPSLVWGCNIRDFQKEFWISIDLTTKHFLLYLSPFKMSFGPQKTAVFLGHVHIWLLLCMIEL